MLSTKYSHLNPQVSQVLKGQECIWLTSAQVPCDSLSLSGSDLIHPCYSPSSHQPTTSCIQYSKGVFPFSYKPCQSMSRKNQWETKLWVTKVICCWNRLQTLSSRVVSDTRLSWQVAQKMDISYSQKSLYVLLLKHIRTKHLWFGRKRTAPSSISSHPNC